jgi:hypothetical protein
MQDTGCYTVYVVPTGVMPLIVHLNSTRLCELAVPEGYVWAPALQCADDVTQ